VYWGGEYPIISHPFCANLMAGLALEESGGLKLPISWWPRPCLSMRTEYKPRRWLYPEDGRRPVVLRERAELALRPARAPDRDLTPVLVCLFEAVLPIAISSMHNNTTSTVSPLCSRLSVVPLKHNAGLYYRLTGSWWDGYTTLLSYLTKLTRSSQPCIPPWSLNRVLALDLISLGKGGRGVSKTVRLAANCYIPLLYLSRYSPIYPIITAIWSDVRTPIGIYLGLSPVVMTRDQCRLMVINLY